jgi:GT2 family glycosyltransferase
VSAHKAGDVVDYVIWIDSDQTNFDHNTIKKLIESYQNNKQFDILSALYFTRDYPSGGIPKPIAMIRQDDGLYEFLKDVQFGRYYNVDVIGFGMCIMRPEILISLYEKHKNKLFMPRWIDNSHIAGEDVVFCELAQKEGYSLGLDTGVCIGHGFYSVDKALVEGMRFYYEHRFKEWVV